MNDKYISREAVLQTLQKANIGGYITERLLEIPSADVQPVIHGRWIITDDVEHFVAICSVCGRTEDSRCIDDMPYCHCGTRMDGDAE